MFVACPECRSSLPLGTMDFITLGLRSHMGVESTGDGGITCMLDGRRSKRASRETESGRLES